ncbi:MAG: sugar ABC transporter substrate-binding protein [Ignavibacteriae bacterium]|nr:sugar ABC transporter substrate-binding protein [Ignavibacteriota bacterium]
MLLVTAIAATIVGCERKQDARVEITFWAMGAEGEHVSKLISAFERLHPDIKVKVQSIPWTAAHEKLLTAYAGSSTPDVSQLGNTWIPEFTILNALEDLDTWIAQSNIVQQDFYFQGIWETNVIDGKTFGIPWYVDTRVMFYRKDILEEAGYAQAPRTWDEWYDASEKIIQKNSRREHYAVLLPTNEWVPFVVMGLQNGSSLLKEGNTMGDFSGEKFQRAFKFVMKFYYNNLSPVGITQVTNIYQGIAEGFFAMYITGPWNIGEFQRRLPAELRDKWMTAPLPGPDSSSGISLAGGSSLVMFKKSNKKEHAWKFIEYLSQAQKQLEFYQITGDLPAIREAWNDSIFTNDKYIQAFYRQLECVVPTPKIPEWEQIAMKVQEYAEVASTQQMSPRDALVALDKEVDKILEKRRWLMEKNK